MKNRLKFKIGEFSKLCQVTVKTLRHYEEMSLLIPCEVDEWTGYRFYDLSQLKQMNRIVYWKQLGFSLEEIKSILEEELDMPSFEMIQAKMEQCLSEIQRLSHRQTELEKLKGLLCQKEEKMENVFVKSLSAGIFATHRQKIESYQELFHLCPEVIGKEMERLGCVCAKPEYCFTVEYQEEYGKEIDIEYFEAVTEMGTDSPLIRFKELKEVPTALCIHHHGAYEKMPETFAQLYAYAEANGLVPSSQARFNYVDGIWNKDNVEDWLTEIQLPIMDV